MRVKVTRTVKFNDTEITTSAEMASGMLDVGRLVTYVHQLLEAVQNKEEEGSGKVEVPVSKIRAYSENG